MLEHRYSFGANYSIIGTILNSCIHLGSRLKRAIKQGTKPATVMLVTGILSDVTRSRTELIAENALLRQQLIVLKRQVKQPKFTIGDRIRLVLLARCTRFWHQALLLVQPDTLLRWYRALFRFYWQRKSRTTTREPRLAQETLDLIKQMAQENRLWGAERIRGEFLNLGIKVSKRTIQKYMPKVRTSSSGSQTWATFLKNHAKDIWACDFTVVHDLFFRPLYIFVIIELQTRRIVHRAVTRSPSDEWTRQQLREATPWGNSPKYLIHDRDNKYGPLFSALAESSGIKVLKTPVRAPRANAICERFIGSLKRECLDHMFILHAYQLHHVVREYGDYYNRSRPHQGIKQRIPARYHPPDQPTSSGKITVKPVLGGLHHAYSCTTYLH